MKLSDFTLSAFESAVSPARPGMIWHSEWGEEKPVEGGCRWRTDGITAVKMPAKGMPRRPSVFHDSIPVIKEAAIGRLIEATKQSSLPLVPLSEVKGAEVVALPLSSSRQSRFPGIVPVVSIDGLPDFRFIDAARLSAVLRWRPVELLRAFHYVHLRFGRSVTEWSVAALDKKHSPVGFIASVEHK